MSDKSPNFFMREFSNDELSKLLINKVAQLKAEKMQTLELNKQLEENVSKLEETACQLEETQEVLKNERDNLKKEVKRKTEELLKKEKLSAIGELAERIAHDMRNPLSVIKNTVELLKRNEKSSNSKTTKHWAGLDRAIYRMSHQVDDVLDFVKLGHVTKKPNKISVIFQDVKARVVLPGNVKLHFPKNDLTVPCDADRLEVVFVNLILNATQALDKKSGNIYISLSEESNEVALITVRDTGPGIPKKLISKIFDPLFTTRQIGTGMGLPSCKNIMEKHGGTIDVSSTRGNGTTFLIRLPLKTEWDNLEQIGNKEKLTDYITSVSH